MEVVRTLRTVSLLTSTPHSSVTDTAVVLFGNEAVAISSLLHPLRDGGYRRLVTDSHYLSVVCTTSNQAIRSLAAAS